MRQGKGLSIWIRGAVLGGMLVLAGDVLGGAQDSPVSSQPSDATTAAIRELQQQVRELRQAVGEMQTEAARYRAENGELRSQLRAVQSQSGAASAAGTDSSYASSPPAGVRPVSETLPQVSPRPAADEPLESRVAALEETLQLLNSKVNDQYQTKVESASKYRVRLSGLVLVNLFSDRGTTDNQDVPSYVTGPNQGNGDFGATLRQSEIGLEVFGPTVAGAKISGSLQADFGGGFAPTWNGVNSGIFRLRTASVRMDWEHTSIVAGQDSLFISPLAPSSYASLLVPAFDYAGNLWAWTPQVRVEHRFALSDGQEISIQAGILDNLAGEFPANTYFRSPGPGENSGQPAYAVRTSWTRNVHGQPLTLGAAGYYSRQDWGYEQGTDGWAGLVDWQIPLFSRWAVSGEFYRGRAIGGLNGSFGRSIVYLGDPTVYPDTPFRALDTVGGWSQLKFRATPKLEFNAGIGVDNPYASEARAGAASQASLGPLFVQNRSALGNFIYRPRSDLLFSAEYRHLQSFMLDNGSNNGQQVNLMMGILF